MRLCFFHIVIPFALLSYGENLHKGNGTGDPKNFYSIHAEENAIKKLPQLSRNKKLKRVDLLVIRANKSGSLGNSKPCVHCIICLYKQLPLKGYILDTIYYSNSDGILKESNLASLTKEELHMTRYYKERNMSIKQ
jgi:hypothetical protein